MTPRPPTPTPADYPRGSHGVAATRPRTVRGPSASRPRRAFCGPTRLCLDRVARARGCSTGSRAPVDIPRRRIAATDSDIPWGMGKTSQTVDSRPKRERAAERASPAPSGPPRRRGAAVATPGAKRRYSFDEILPQADETTRRREGAREVPGGAAAGRVGEATPERGTPGRTRERVDIIRSLKLALDVIVVHERRRRQSADGKDTGDHFAAGTDCWAPGHNRIIFFFLFRAPRAERGGASHLLTRCVYLPQGA